MNKSERESFEAWMGEKYPHESLVKSPIGSYINRNPFYMWIATQARATLADTQLKEMHAKLVEAQREGSRFLDSWGKRYEQLKEAEARIAELEKKIDIAEDLMADCDSFNWAVYENKVDEILTNPKPIGDNPGK